jgi:hypothetical protein
MQRRMLTIASALVISYVAKDCAGFVATTPVYTVRKTWQHGAVGVIVPSRLSQLPLTLSTTTTTTTTAKGNDGNGESSQQLVVVEDRCKKRRSLLSLA